MLMQCAGRSACALFFGKALQEKLGKGGQLLLLGHIDIEALILQPVVGVDGDVALFVGVDDEGIGGIFVPVSL